MQPFNNKIMIYSTAIVSALSWIVCASFSSSAVVVLLALFLFFHVALLLFLLYCYFMCLFVFVFFCFCFFFWCHFCCCFVCVKIPHLFVPLFCPDSSTPPTIILR